MDDHDEDSDGGSEPEEQGEIENGAEQGEVENGAEAEAVEELGLEEDDEERGTVDDNDAIIGKFVLPYFDLDKRTGTYYLKDEMLNLGGNLSDFDSEKDDAEKSDEERELSAMDNYHYNQFELSYVDLEKMYRRKMRVQFCDDVNNVPDDITRNLTAVNHCLRIIRRYRRMVAFANNEDLEIPEFAKREYASCKETLESGSQFLTQQKYVQIRDTGDMDVALHLIKGNPIADNLCIFCLKDRTILSVLNGKAEGLFRAIVQHKGDWGAGDLEYGGRDPPRARARARAPAPARARAPARAPAASPDATP